MRQRCSLGDQPSDAYLSSLLGKSHFIATAATIHELVVGGLTAYQLDKFEQDRREICIYDLAVNEEYRRRGIATSTIEALRVEAARRDAYVIFVQADLEDAPAIALYEKLPRTISISRRAPRHRDHATIDRQEGDMSVERTPQKRTLLAPIVYAKSRARLTSAAMARRRAMASAE